MFENINREIDREILIESINKKGLNNNETWEMLAQYLENLRQEQNEINPDTSNMEVTLHMAELYDEVGMTEEAQESLRLCKEEAEKTNNLEMIGKVKELLDHWIEKRR